MYSATAIEFQIYSTCPQSRTVDSSRYAGTVAEHARWSEDAGFAGMLIYTDNGLVDPWLVAQTAMTSTRTLCPLVAVQPVYMHPYTAAKMIATLGFLHGRRMALNMLAGGFRNDLIALGDTTPHDDRYARTIEYTLILRRLLAGQGPVGLDGRYYQVANLEMTPALPAELQPVVLISGSSDAGMRAAEAIGATAIRYPRPAGQEEDAEAAAVPCGIRVGIIARDTDEEAWRVALERFPACRRGAVTHRLAMSVSDSVWHHQLSGLADRPGGPDSPYWLGPFQQYQTFCPYLVGTYDAVGAELARYMGKGYRSCILDIVPSADEFGHIAIAFGKARERLIHDAPAA